MRLLQPTKAEDFWLHEEILYELDVPSGPPHRLRVRASGQLVLENHDRAEVRRQLHYAEIGGEPCPCVAVLVWWQKWQPGNPGPNSDIPETVRIARRDLHLCATQNRTLRKFDAARHHHGRVLLDTRLVKVRDFRHFSEAHGILGRAFAAVVFRLLRRGFEVRCDQAGMPGQRELVLTLDTVNGLSLHHRFRLSSGDRIVYEDSHENVWAESLLHQFPAQAIASRVAWNVLSQAASGIVLGHKQKARERICDLAGPDLAVSYSDRRLTLQITPGNEAPGPETAAALVRKVNKLAQFLARRSHGDTGERR